MNMFNRRSEDTLVELYSNTRNVLMIIEMIFQQ